MLSHQRQNTILAHLNHQQQVTVAELVDALQCSEATIRRDLQLLEQQGQLRRVHGGAVPIVQEDTVVESPITVRQAMANEEKQRIAQYAAQHFLNHAQTIFLDAGTSTAAVIPLLNPEKVTVVTNGAHHISELVAHGITTVLLGGTIKPTTQAVYGDTTIQQLKRFAFDLAILGVNGVDLTFGLSTPDPQEAIIKETAIAQATQTLVLADSSKFHQRFFCQFAQLQQVTVLTTSAPREYRRNPHVITINSKGGA